MRCRWVILWCLLGLAAPDAGRAQGYGYPFVDALAATVIGTPAIYTADLPEEVPLEEMDLVVFADREIPELFWYTDRLRFGFLAQDRKAPLAFVIAGTGASHDADKVRTLVKMFHKIGFHVITLPSPTHQNFIVTASTTSVPGLITEDAADLYRVMRMADDGNGPFLVLPIFGPSNLRDTGGLVVDNVGSGFMIPGNVSTNPAYLATAYGLQPIDKRNSIPFRYYRTGSPFEYDLVRLIYTNFRQAEIAR